MSNVTKTRIAHCGHSYEITLKPGARGSRTKLFCAACSPKRVIGRSCRCCGREFPARLSDPRKQFCSSNCRLMSRGDIRIGPRQQRICVLVECGQPFMARKSSDRGCCAHHNKIQLARDRRADGREPHVETDRRRDAHQRRRAMMLGARTGGSVFLSDVIARDGVGCKLCGNPVDLSLKYPNPFSKSVDHIIPLSRGGAHEPDNCQLAHLRCNISKGARVAA